MKLTLRLLLLAAFVLWEACWSYVLITAPRPDYEMATVMALFMGLGLPVAIALVLGLFPSFWKLLDRKRQGHRRSR